MISKPNLVLIAKLQDMIHDCLKDCISADEPVAMVDFPDYKNVGDFCDLARPDGLSFIAIQQNAVIHFGAAEPLARQARRGDARGGRSSSPEEERSATSGRAIRSFARAYLERWPGRLVVQLPQSIHYKSQEGADRMARAIARHKNFVLLVRDEEIEGVRADAFRLPGAALSGHGVQGRFDPAVVGRAIPGSGHAAHGPGKGRRSYDFSAYPDIPVEDWITSRAPPSVSPRRSAPRRGRFARSRADQGRQAGCGGQGQAAARHPPDLARARDRHRSPARPHLRAVARAAACRAGQQLRQGRGGS